MSQNIESPARKITWPMIALTGATFLGGGVWMVSMVASFMPGRADPQRVQFAGREVPQINLYVTQNGEAKPPAVFQMPQPVQPSVHMEQPYSSESMPVQSPQRFRRTLLQQVQLPVFRPDELPREGFFDNEQESYRNQFPNACKPQVWNPQCQSMSDTGWEEVQRVPQDFELPRPEQWTKVGSYLCIKHAGYYPINHTRCWQRT